MAERALITGANRGIGLALVEEALARGIHVVACCREPERATELNALMRARDGHLQVAPLEVTNAVQVQRLAAQVQGEGLDYVLANAGVYGPKGLALDELEASVWTEVMRINTIAPIELLRAMVPALEAGQRKVFVAMSSKMGSIGDNASGGSYVYRSSKAALNAAVRSAALDLRERGLTVVPVHPGWVQTEMGGPSALITTAECARTLWDLFQGLTLEHSGRFLERDGRVIPW